MVARILSLVMLLCIARSLAVQGLFGSLPDFSVPPECESVRCKRACNIFRAADDKAENCFFDGVNNPSGFDSFTAYDVIREYRNDRCLVKCFDVSFGEAVLKCTEGKRYRFRTGIPCELDDFYTCSAIGSGIDCEHTVPFE